MGIEEKAKAYDEALKRAKAVMDVAANQDEARGIATTIFPELRESEDEKVWQWIREHINHDGTNMFDKAVAWLEKQKDFTTVTNIQEAYRKGFDNAIEAVKQQPEKYGLQKEQKPADVDYVSGIRKELLGIEDNAKNIDGLTESQWVAIRAAHRLLGEYVEQEQKHAEWSEKDKTHLGWIIECFDSWKHQVPEFADQYQSAINWLKSLRPQSHWKPSKEQIDALDYAYCVLFDKKDVGDNILSPLQKLYDELKKQM